MKSSAGRKRRRRCRAGFHRGALHKKAYGGIVYESSLLILSVEFAFVPVCLKKQTFTPRRRASHLFADRLYRYVAAGFNDHFVVDMADDIAEGECLYGVGQDILGNRLHDVLGQLFGKCLRPLPFRRARLNPRDIGLI